MLSHIKERFGPGNYRKQLSGFVQRILQVVEARRRGYPRRYSYEAFLRRFGKLCDMTHSPNREGAVCLVDALASSLSLERDAIVVGRTKVFLRARAEALIEGARDKALRKSALKELEIKRKIR